MLRLLALLVLALLPQWTVPALAQSDLMPHQLDVPARDGRRSVTLWVLDGFSISVVAHGLGTARVVAEAPTGELVVSDMNGGRVLILADHDADGVAEDVTPLLTGLRVPHGLAFDGTALYIGETHQVLRLEPWNDPASARAVIRLPADNDTGGHPNHKTRTLAMGPDRKLYVSIGSFCDACTETDPKRATIWRFGLDGGDGPDGNSGELVASGLRNAVGMAFEPGTDRLWVTENGSNHLGNDLPPDEINIVQAAGSNFGWPYCYGAREVQLPLGNAERCAATVPSALDLPAHIAPLGLTFVSGDLFPAEYQHDVFMALHGSALRQDAVGYSLVRVPVRDGQPQQPVEFVRGWLVGDDSWGRPVQPVFTQDGSLLLTDDKAGVLYRIRPSR